MSALQAEAASLSYLDLPPVFVIGQTEAAQRRAARTIGSAGFRMAGPFDLGQTPARLSLQGTASAVWLELDEDTGEEVDKVLECVNDRLSDHRCGLVVSAPPELVELSLARLDKVDVEFVVNGTDADRCSALALITSAFARCNIHDVASDQNNARLRQLSDEVSRIAATLARLSTGPSQPARPQEGPPAKDIPEVSVDTVRAVIRARRLRSRFFAEDLFADPAWDMLLDLLQAELAQLRVPVSSLCIAAAVPATTALRWLKTMTSQGLFVRRADPHDGRRVFVELDPSASIAMRRYFAEVGNPATI
ncbi:MAG TPA: MarR family winged helix-turn-helix transcriptional regulator [Sphingomicrobium sp.]|nr:MarR family winged helix-turn-helix transcriptional regulator [Sphingomicrobium sp.]